MRGAVSNKYHFPLRANLSQQWASPAIGIMRVPQIIGYARVSTEEQILDVQINALKAANCDHIFKETISAVNAKRPAFGGMMKHIEPEDTVLFHSLSRMGREVDQILGILKGLTNDGITWRSLTEPHLDPTTSAGKLMINVTSSMAQFERDQIIERTKRGMAAAVARGQYLGAPVKVTPVIELKMRRMRKAKVPVWQIAQDFDVSNAAVYSHTKH